MAHNSSKLDANQVLQHAYDDTTQRLRTDAVLSMDSAVIDVNIDHINDSIKIGDGTDILQINPDGSINVNANITSTPATPINVYNEILAVASGSSTNIATYTVPTGVTTKLRMISFSGGNIATYTVTVNGTPIDKKRTYFGGEVDGVFDYTDYGYEVNPGDFVAISVLHNRPDPADFNARIQVLET